ncbi:MAG: ATP-binding cassette domain-containing protein [Cytophagales bacterium]|nr:ATP-binding cassette domain-containing protein [Cytophagales bacterium]
MNERLLRSIMHLFAIIAKEDGISPLERGVVEDFLRVYLHSSKAEYFLKVFDHFVAQASGRFLVHDISGSIRSLPTVRDSSRMMLICEQINGQLNQAQKIILTIKIYELIMADGVVSETEREFVETIASALNLDEGELRNIENFVIQATPQGFTSAEMLLITSELPLRAKPLALLFAPTLQGEIIVLRVPSVRMYFIKYLGLASTYTLNGLPIYPGKIYHFPRGSSIRGNRFKTIFYSDVVSKLVRTSAETRITFEALSLYYHFPNGDPGLQNVTLSEQSGRLVGIMGASGAGKSTLLDVLSGSKKPYAGTVLLNGEDIYASANRPTGIIGYVPQRDQLFERLTVYQNLYYAARLSYGKHNNLGINRIVYKTLRSMGLLEIAHLEVGSEQDKTISGGQRKRLNIALELVRQPAIFFVDEPTSGLSSRDSLQIMDLLRELSLRGKLVISVIHQPSSDIFKMFDTLLVLDKGGLPVYSGNPSDAIRHFRAIVNHVDRESAECETCGNINPEEIFNLLEEKTVNEFGRSTGERRISPDQWHEEYKKSNKIKRVKPNRSELRPEIELPSRLKQYSLFLGRDLLAKLKNKQFILLALLEAPLLAGLLATVCRHSSEPNYYLYDNDNLLVYIFVSVISALFIGLTLSAEEIFRDRKIWRRESFMQLSRLSFLCAKTSVMLGIVAIQTFCFVLIGNSVMGIEGLTLPYWLMLFAVAAFSVLLGLNISSAFNSVVTIIS